MDPETRTIESKSDTFKKEGNISLKLLLGYGVGHVFNDISATIWFTYLLIYFHWVLGFSGWEAGFMLLLGQVADAVSNLIIGYASDKLRIQLFERYGKRKSWHFIGTLLVTISVPFCYSPCLLCTSESHWKQIIYYAIFIIIFQFGFSAIQLSHLSLIPELSQYKHVRTKLVAVRYSFSVLANIFVYIVAWLVFGIRSTTIVIAIEDAPKFQIIVGICCLVGIICSILFHLLIKENISNNDKLDINTEKKIKVSDIFGKIKHYQVTVVYVSSTLFNTISQIFIPMYLHETLNMSTTSVAFVPLTMYLGSLAASTVVEKLNIKLGRKGAYLIGAGIGLAGCLWIRLGTWSNETVYQILAVAVIFGIGSSMVLVTSLGLISDVIGEKTASGAFIFSIVCITDKIANGVSAFFVQYLHNIYLIREYYEYALVCICGGAMVLGTFAAISLGLYQKKSLKNNCK